MKPPSYDGDRGKWNGPAKLPSVANSRKLNDVTGRNASWRLHRTSLSGNRHDWERPHSAITGNFRRWADSLGQGREIRLFGDPIGGRDHAETERIVVQPGQQIEWTLEPELRRSSVAVY